MTTKKYLILMGILLVAPTVIVVGGIAIIAESKWLTDRFTDHMWKGLIKDTNEQWARRQREMA